MTWGGDGRTNSLGGGALQVRWTGNGSSGSRARGRKTSIVGGKNERVGGYVFYLKNQCRHPDQAREYFSWHLSHLP